MNSLVRSRLVYGCQGWSLTKQLLQKISSSYSSILRKMINGGFRRKHDTWSFVLSNGDVLRQCGAENIESFIRRQQRNYLAHIVRQDDDSLCKRLTFNDDRRRQGRHTTTRTMVLEHEKLDGDEFNREAMLRNL